MSLLFLLAELIKELDVITYNDSLLNLCKMPEKEVLALIKDIIDKKAEELERKREKKELEGLIASNGFMETTVSPNAGKLFIWDQNLMGLGYNEFNKIWGKF